MNSPAPAPAPARPQRLRDFLLGFWPAPVQVAATERWRALAGAGVGILFTALLSRWWNGAGTAVPWLAAPLGASAVLVFALPASPLAQPWAVVGGNTLSALVGAACAMLIPDPAWAGAVAVAAAIGLMFVLRCLHPPGGATALLTAMAASSFHFAVFPMLVDSLLLAFAGVLYNSLTGKRYPHAQRQPATSSSAPPTSRFTTADLDAALVHYNQVLDVSRDDLEALLQHAEAAAYQRNFGQLQCRDIMSRAPWTVQFGTPLGEAWALMRARRVKALPVIDRAQRIVGIVTVADFMRHADVDRHDGFADRLRALIRPGTRTHGDKPEAVGQIMTREVRVASEHRQVAELVPLFSDAGHHHIPIIDADQRLVGVITQSDLVRALYRAAQPGG